jgi:uncharacterized protein YktB (UPF0637 family)
MKKKITKSLERTLRDQINVLTAAYWGAVNHNVTMAREIGEMRQESLEDVKKMVRTVENINLVLGTVASWQRELSYENAPQIVTKKKKDA